MKTSDNRSIVIGLACAVTIIALWRAAGATNTQSGSPLRWEYAQLRIRGDSIVFCQGTKESVVTPATDRLSSRRTGGGSNSARYVVKTAAKRNHVVAAMDVFGEARWEVASVVSAGRGGTEMVVLMKRQY